MSTMLLIYKNPLVKNDTHLGNCKIFVYQTSLLETAKHTHDGFIMSVPEMAILVFIPLVIITVWEFCSLWYTDPHACSVHVERRAISFVSSHDYIHKEWLTSWAVVWVPHHTAQLVYYREFHVGAGFLFNTNAIQNTVDSVGTDFVYRRQKVPISTESRSDDNHSAWGIFNPSSGNVPIVSHLTYIRGT